MDTSDTILDCISSFAIVYVANALPLKVPKTFCSVVVLACITMVFRFFLFCELVLFVFVVFSIKYPHRLTNYFAFFGFFFCLIIVLFLSW